eukprot:6185190-Pleurochrysis_carterae.AAC.3
MDAHWLYALESESGRRMLHQSARGRLPRAAAGPSRSLAHAGRQLRLLSLDSKSCVASCDVCMAHRIEPVSRGSGLFTTRVLHQRARAARPSPENLRGPPNPSVDSRSKASEMRRFQM